MSKGCDDPPIRNLSDLEREMEAARRGLAEAQTRADAICYREEIAYLSELKFKKGWTSSDDAR